MNKTNDKGERYGPWKSYYTDAKLYSKGTYINDKQHGLWEWYYNNYTFINKEFYL